MNRLSVIGRIVQDVVLESKGDYCWVKNSIAVNDKIKKDGKFIEDTIYIDFVAFGNNATYINNFSAKGKRIFLDGSLKCDKWIDKDNNKRTSYYLNVEKVEIVDYKEEQENE